MVDYVPLARSTHQLIEQAKAREDALSRLDEIMGQATGSAHDANNAVRVTVDARGKLLNLQLGPNAADFGERLGQVIVQVARIAQQVATQDSYNKVALLLGDQMTYAIEQISGVRSPARAKNDDGGLTPEEFQRRRAERLRVQAPAQHRRAEAPEPPDEDDWESFDPSTLRSDR